MNNFKHNIYFFWDKNTPDVYLKHVDNIRQMYRKYNVHLINDNWVIQYFTKKKDVEFLKIYKKITLGAAKSDLVRFILMYEYGGLYLDIMNYPKENLNMDELFAKLVNKSVYVGYLEPNYISFQVMLCKPKSALIKQLYELCKNNLIEHYEKELVSTSHVKYNLILLTGPILFHDVVVSKKFDKWNTYLKCIENATENLSYFEKWDCELVDCRKTFYLYQ